MVANAFLPFYNWKCDGRINSDFDIFSFVPRSILVFFRSQLLLLLMMECEMIAKEL